MIFRRLLPHLPGRRALPQSWLPQSWLPQSWRLPSAFDAAGYLAAHPDLAGLGATAAAWHFLRHGRREGRLPRMLEAARLEAALWAGDPAAAGALTRLAGSGAPQTAETLWARLALARAALAEDDPARAGAVLQGGGPDMAGALARVLGLPDPLLLLAGRALQDGDSTGAARLLRLARRLTGRGRAGRRLAERGPGLALMQAALARAGAGDAAWSPALAPLYAGTGLAPPDLLPADLSCGPLPAFDRLTARPGPAVPEGPLVSVIVPMRDAASTIDTALTGLCAQSWRALEILVVDNGSADGSVARVLARAGADSRIRLIDGAQAPGAYGARNLGLARATGEIVALHDADDWSHPERIARQMQALAAAPDRPACLSHWARMSGDLIPAAGRPDLAVVHQNLSSLMIRRDAVRQIGVWDQVRAGADTEYILRLRQVFGAQAVVPVLPDVPLAFGRQRAGSLSRAAETGLLGPGAAARTAYLAAARDWHSRAGRPSLAPDLSPDDPRPFPAPAALRIGPSEEAGS